MVNYRELIKKLENEKVINPVMRIDRKNNEELSKQIIALCIERCRAKAQGL